MSADNPDQDGEERGPLRGPPAGKLVLFKANGLAKTLEMLAVGPSLRCI